MSLRHVDANAYWYVQQLSCKGCIGSKVGFGPHFMPMICPRRGWEGHMSCWNEIAKSKMDIFGN